MRIRRHASLGCIDASDGSGWRRSSGGDAWNSREQRRRVKRGVRRPAASILIAARMLRNGTGGPMFIAPASKSAESTRGSVASCRKPRFSVRRSDAASARVPSPAQEGRSSRPTNAVAHCGASFLKASSKGEGFHTSQTVTLRGIFLTQKAERKGSEAKHDQYASDNSGRYRPLCVA